jgi:hypothetical protein
MTLAIEDAAPPAAAVADGALSETGTLSPGATILVMRAHFELLAVASPAAPSTVRFGAVAADDLQGVSLRARVESGVLLLDYPQSVCP